MQHWTQSQFNQAVGYARVREKNREAAFKHLVQGRPMYQIAQEMQCSRQNIYRVVKIIEAARLEYLEAMKRMKK